MADLFEVPLEAVADDGRGFMEGPERDRGADHGPLDEIAAYCRDLYNECSQSEYRERKLAERDENRKRYRGDRDPTDDPWPGCSNRSLMIDATVVDNLEPRIMAQLFGDEDFVDIEPVGPEDVRGVKPTKEFLKWACRENMDIEEQMKPAVHDMLLDGTAYVIPTWHEEERMNMVREPVPILESPNGPVEIGPEEMQHPTVQMLIQQGAIRFAGFGERINWRTVTDYKVKIEQVPLNDAFTPDTGLDWETQPFMRMIYPLYHELEELSEANGGPYFNIDRALIHGQSRSGTDEHDTDEDAQGVRHSEYSEECPLLECHIPWRGEWFLVAYSIHAGWKEVRRQPMLEVFAHGRKAPRRLSIFRESNESMGTGLPHKIRHFSTGADETYNQMINNGTLENLPWGTYEENPGGFMGKLKAKPGEFIGVPKGSNVQFPRFATDATRFMAFIELLLQMQERLVSLNNYTQAGQINRGSAGTETYAGMSLLVNESNIRHAYTGRGLRSEVSRLVKDILSLYGQYLPYDAQMRVMEGDDYTFKPFDLQAIQGEYDIKINVSSSSGNKMLQRQEAQELYGALGARPEANGMWLVERLLDSYDVKNTDDAIRPEINQLVQMFMADPEVLQAAQQFMQQKQEQMRRQEVQGQAQANIERQQIQRQAEAPLENQKIIDQATESAKRQFVKPVIEQDVAARAMMGQL